LIKTTIILRKEKSDMKLKKLIAMITLISMVSTMAACGSGNGGSDDTTVTNTASDDTVTEDTAADEGTTAADDNTADDTQDNTAAAEQSGLHEIYTLTERNALSGLVSPDYSDRSDIDKALPTEKKSDLTIGLSMGQTGSEFFTAMIDACQEACDKYGYKLVWTNADGNISTQSADVESMITSGVDAIILNPMDVTASEADVQAAVEAGIPVIGTGVDYPESVPVITSILANNYFGGWETGVYLGDFFKDQHIKAAALLGMMGHTIDESRINGMIAGIIYKRAEQTGNAFASEEDAYLEANEMFNELRSNGSLSSDKWDLEIVAQGEGSWSIDGGLAASEDIIVGHPDINLMMCSCDPMGQGAITAIEGAGLEPGKDVYVACAADGGKEIFKLLEDGKMQVTGYNCPYLNGSSPVDLIYKIFEEDFDAANLPAATDLPTGCITKENWKDFYDENMEYCKPIDFEFKSIDQLKSERS